MKRLIGIGILCVISSIGAEAQAAELQPPTIEDIESAAPATKEAESAAETTTVAPQEAVDVEEPAPPTPDDIDEEEDVEAEPTAGAPEDVDEGEETEPESPVEAIPTPEEEASEEQVTDSTPEEPEQPVEVTDAEVPAKVEEDMDDELPEMLLSEEEAGFRGNWVKKKQWLHRARMKNEKIQELVTEIQQSRMPLMQEYLAIDEHFDALYLMVGGRKIDLQAFFGELSRYIEHVTQERLAKAKNDNRENVHLIRDKIQEEADTYRKEFEAFKDDVKRVQDIDTALRKRVEVLDQKIAEAVEEGEKARKLYDIMWDLIDDTKAERNFYELKGVVGQKVKSIHAYLTGIFARDFQTTINTGKKQIEKTKARIEQLEKRGLIIMDRQDRIKEIKGQKRADAAVRKEAAARKKEKDEQPGGLEIFLESIRSSVDSLRDVVRQLYEYVFPPEKSAPKPVQIESKESLSEAPEASLVDPLDDVPLVPALPPGMEIGQ